MFYNKKWLVLGAGASGIGAAKFLHERGAVVAVYDDGIVATKSRARWSCPFGIFIKDEKQIEFECFDFCVISPGVSINHPIAVKFAGKIISEMALGFCAPHKKIVAITGTNGKTTVTNMIADALCNRGVRCGNIGTPVTCVTNLIASKIAVTEVSSFMLEASSDFAPDIAVILNITQDHLERHGSMDEYARCKAEIAKNSKVVVLNYDDENCRNIGGENVYYFSTKQPVRGVYISGDDIYFNKKRVFRLCEFDETKAHSIENILAVVLVCKLLGVRRRAILGAVAGFGVRQHRIQPVGGVGNVTFYNDSKATNIAATIAACRCFSCPVNLIVGGVCKGQNFEELFTKLPRHVEHIFCFGQSADDIIRAAEAAKFEGITRCDTLEGATRLGYQTGFGVRSVLLSPACASFDQFKNYAERGEKFISIVQEIIKEEEARAGDDGKSKDSAGGGAAGEERAEGIAGDD